MSDAEGTASALEYRLTFGYFARVKVAFALIPESWLALVVMSIFPLGAIACVFVMLREQQPLGDAVVAYLPMALFPLLIIPLSQAIAYWTNPVLREEFTYRLDPTGIHCISKNSEFVHKWPAILRVKLRVGYLFFFFSRKCAHCIPVAAVEQSGTMAELLALVRKSGVRIEGE